MKKAAKLEVVTTTGTALAIPQAVLPKPTKTELIEALLERARIKHGEARTAYEKKRDELRKKVIDLAKKEMKKAPVIHSTGLRGWENTAYVEVKYHISTPEILKLMKEIEELVDPRGFDAAATKRNIRESLSRNPAGRVNPLLSNNEAVKSLDQFIADHAIA